MADRNMEDREKREKMCHILSSLYNRPCFFWGHCLKLKMSKLAFIEVFLGPEGSCDSPVDLRPAC